MSLLRVNLKNSSSETMEVKVSTVELCSRIAEAAVNDLRIDGDRQRARSAGI